MRNFFITLLFVLFFVSSALFFAQNDGLVTIRYFIGEVEWQLNWVMILSLLAGFGLGIASLLGGLLKAKLQLRLARGKLQQHEQELNNLRALPMKDDY